jgi:hypothetical protein
MKKVLFVSLVILTLTACGGGTTGNGDGGGGGGGDDEITTGDGASTVATEAAVEASMSAMGDSMANMQMPDQTMIVGKTALPQTAIDYTYDCTGAGTVDWSGTLDIDYVSDGPNLESIGFDFVLDGEFNGCSVEDDTTTTDFDESDVVLDGNIDSSTNFDMTFGGSMSLTITMEGTFTISGVCDEGGTLTLDLGATVTGDVPSDPSAMAGLDWNDFGCELTGTVTGTVCGETVDVTATGDCTAPTIEGADDGGGGAGDDGDGDDDDDDDGDGGGGTDTADENGAAASAAAMGLATGAAGTVGNAMFNPDGPPAMIVKNVVMSKVAGLFKAPPVGATMTATFEEGETDVDVGDGTVSLTGTLGMEITDTTLDGENTIAISDISGDLDAEFTDGTASATIDDETYNEIINGTATFGVEGTAEALFVGEAMDPDSVDVDVDVSFADLDLTITGDVEGTVTYADLVVNVIGDMVAHELEYTCSGSVTATVGGEDVVCNVTTDCTGCDEE